MFCMIQGAVLCLPCKKFEVHSNAPTTVPRPTSNTQENLKIQCSKKTWKMENDGSLAPPPPPRLLDKGEGGGGGALSSVVCLVLFKKGDAQHFALCKNNRPKCSASGAAGKEACRQCEGRHEPVGTIHS